MSVYLEESYVGRTNSTMFLTIGVLASHIRESAMKSQFFGNQVFVPVTDEMIYDHPEQIGGPLIPYAAGMECHEWISIEINPDESRVANVSNCNESFKEPYLAYNAG